jgi:uncharacterized membrane protein YphA (DoxX/SURF4 family)
MTLVRRAARPLLSATFVSGGLDSIRNAAPKAAAAERVTPMVTRLLPQLPSDPVALIRLNGAIQVAGGIALALGIFPRVSSGLLAVSLVPTTLAGHPFWEEEDPAKRRAQRLHFLKNLGLLGGLLLAAVDTEGEPGVAWRTRHATGEIQASARRFTGRARREAKFVTRAAKQEARLLRAEAKAKLAA